MEVDRLDSGVATWRWRVVVLETHCGCVDMERHVAMEGGCGCADVEV